MWVEQTKKPYDCRIYSWISARNRESARHTQWIFNTLQSVNEVGYRNDYVSDISYLDKLEKFKDTPHRIKIQGKFLESSELSDLLSGMAVKNGGLWPSFLLFQVCVLARLLRWINRMST